MGTTIEIQGKKYPLKYGYGAFRLLGETWECPSVQKVAKKFQEIFPAAGIEDVSFEQANALGELALAGIQNALPRARWQDLPELDDVVNELLFQDSTKINLVMTAFTESFPKSGNAEPRSPARKAATKKK
jgi:hypothetical protein